MATEQVRKSGADPTAVADPKSTALNSGPYEAVVVAHAAGTRLGQLRVKVITTSTRDLPADEGNTVVANYCSPFFGTTFGTDQQSDRIPEGAYTSGQSYGMWMVPPDIGNKVLVMCTPAGDWYWIGCIYDSSSHHMVPAIGRNIGGKDRTRAPGSLPASGSSNLPVVEYSTKYEPTAFDADGLENTPRYTHEFQASRLIMQGLDRDLIRGAISSSSLRESPSNVYGISTPGRKVSKGDQVPGEPDKVFARQGGHTFVMDDGDAAGKDQLMRLRTTGGHQILMNDSENILYIASASGNQWLEFSKNGQINVYGAAGFNLRTQGVLNLHSDVLLNMSAPNIKMTAMGNDKAPLGSISMATSGNFSASAVGLASLKCNGMLTLSAVGRASLTAGGWLSLSSQIKTSINSNGMLMLNSGLALPPFPVLPPTVTPKPDTKLQGGVWNTGGVIMTACTVAPAHEPWLDANGQRPKK
jgi:hypothetical protein